MYGYTIKSPFGSVSGMFYIRKDKSLTQFSSLISVNIALSKLGIGSKFNIAFDTGKLYGNNVGISFFILKKW